MRVTVVGLGPGAGRDLTGRAREALEQAELIIGYTAYIELIREEFSHKEMRSTGMRPLPRGGGGGCGWKGCGHGVLRRLRHLWYGRTGL